jgi:hypothetical protein
MKMVVQMTLPCLITLRKLVRDYVRIWRFRPVHVTLSACLWGLFFPALAHANWKTSRENLDERHTVGEIRIHYARQGKDAVGNPSKIQRLAEQFSRANTFYADTLGLTPSTKNIRYSGLQAIDVHVLKMEDAMGTAGDAKVTYRYKALDDHKPSLTISLSSRWEPGNRTPEHELFHSYQYGYTFFKNPWYLEGMARAMQGAFETKPYRTATLPQTGEQLQALMGRSYGASTFWNRLMMLCDQSCAVPVNSASTAIEFRPLSGPMCGGGMIKTVLEKFREQDGKAAKARKLDVKNWPEDEQRAEINNPWILAGLTDAMTQHCPIQSNVELTKFHDAAQELSKGLRN